MIVRAFWPQSAYVWFFGVALFGALFVWLMIFVTHIAFCAPRVPIASYAGAALIAAILASTWWVPASPSYLYSLLVGCQVWPPSSERCVTWPNQPPACEAYSRLGSAAEPLMC